MTLFSKPFGLLLLTSFLLVPNAESRDRECDSRVKYVQGDACTPGDGSKKHPFKTLADAEADEANWDVLIVLSSKTPLTGIINLLDGRKLIGEEDPTGTILSLTQPTISNGGITIDGEATIENIFLSSGSVGINYSNATNLKVKNTLISDFALFGLLGSGSHSGKTYLNNVIIRNCPQAGMFDSVSQPSAHRELLITSSAFISNGLVALNFSNELNTSSSLTIKDSNFDGSQFFLQLAPNGEETVKIEASSFNKSLSAISTLNKGNLKLKVDGCLIEQSSFAAFQLGNGDLSSETLIKNSVITEKTAAAISLLINEPGINSTETICLINNIINATNLFNGFQLASSDSGTSKVTMKDNFFTGTTISQIITQNPWKSLTIEADHNCFEGNGGTAFSSSILNQNSAGAGNVRIQAHKNSISNFSTDISDIQAKIVYDVSKNWWGHAVNPTCSNVAPCVSPYQTCLNGICQGPIVNPGFTGTIILPVDPLDHSIKCPHNCCQPLPTPTNI